MSDPARTQEHAEHFESLEKQEYAANLGMWVFLGSETLLFAGLFGLYTAYRNVFPAEFHEASLHNDLAIGTTNTVILIVSSFTVAWAVHAIRHDRRRMAALALLATILLGATFLVLKGFEYRHHLGEGIYPGGYYAYEALPGAGARMFFTLYYFMTGLHALHVVGGLGLMLWLLVAVRRGRINARRHVALENGALYWHLVDLVWIFLWPLLYLVG